MFYFPMMHLIGINELYTWLKELDYYLLQLGI